MSRVIVLAPIGSSDLRTGALALEQMGLDPTGRGHKNREVSKVVLDAYDEVRPHLAIPILEQIVSWLRRERPEDSPRFQLIATNQPGDVGQRSTDTVFTAQVAARLLREAGFEVDVNDVRDDEDIRRDDPLLVTDDPFNYATQHAEWDGRLARMKARYDDAELIVCAAAGIPAVITALIVRGVQHFRGACTILYVPGIGGGRSGEAQVVPIGTAMWREDVARTFPQALAAHQYDRAAAIVADYPFCFYDAGLVAKALAATVARVAFDFGPARLPKHLLREAEERADCAPAMRALVARLREDRQALTLLLRTEADATRDTARLGELFSNCLMQYRIGHYADFLGRYVALLDALLPFMIGRVVGKWFNSALEMGHWFRHQAAAGTFDGSQFAPVRHLISNLPQKERESERLYADCFDGILANLCTGHSPVALDCAEYHRLAPFRRWLNSDTNRKLNKLRNASEIAHGFRAVGQDQIDAIYGGRYFSRPGHTREDFGLGDPTLVAPPILADLAHVMRQVAGLAIPSDDLAPLLTAMILPATARA